MIKKLNYSGDTIVEVLISIVVASTVIAGAYVATNRSIKNNRQVFEHSQALITAQGQAERLKANAELYPASTSDSIFSTATVVDQTDINLHTTANSYFCIPNVNAKMNPNATCPTNGGAYFNYDTYINRFQTPAGSGKYIFVITTRWEGVNGGTDSVTLLYKVNKP